MWRFVLTFSLLCWGSEATVSCRNVNNGIVDWYIIYKAPLTSSMYLYIDSTGITKMEPSTPNYKSISDPTGVLANTLEPIFKPIRSMPNEFGFISYNDQPPGCQANDVFGHSKGVLMMDKHSTGVWLLHSTPNFPFRRDPNHFWPSTGESYAQTFICATFNYQEFSNIGNHLQYIGAFPFEYDVPVDFHQELRDAVNWVKKPAPNNFRTLTSSGSQGFRSFAKQQNAQPKIGDLYVNIAQLLGSDVSAQTWTRDQPGSYCVKNMHKVFNVKTVKTDLGDWSASKDHSKWCVPTDSQTHWTCIADVNRAPTQNKRRGGALCIESEAVQKIFLHFAGITENCLVKNDKDIFDQIMDLLSFLRL
ncbi:plancitoxin-1-like [Anoplopoma fimbria]|uniref:plancitoxin-1-like n=1 Tax=Anoplopoma fimbria TaxID=229290 RepID=UPI0023ECF263|nr:plancitoxin-1-like [Anoplopoma fimbria]XP_054468952.1 plancitoxin-1-like [Anoplopoma fimbria]